jgi:enamine deaminase RidA (YjgF/YER057c/UK114 family)
MSALDRLRELGFELPALAPRHEFMSVNVIGDLAFISGHAPFRQGEFQYNGKVGRDLDARAGREAAELALLGCLASLQDCLGTLERVQRVVKMNGYVNCDPGFRDLPAITDAASTILGSIFGERGRHARTTVGVNSLPQGVAVEIELIVQVNADGAGCPAED